MDNERPSNFPEWATDAGADIVEPSQGQKEIGWLPNDRPPAGWLNWWKNNCYNWMKYLDELGLNTASLWACNYSAVDIFINALGGTAFNINKIASMYGGVVSLPSSIATIFVGHSNEYIYTEDFITYEALQLTADVNDFIYCIGAGDDGWLLSMYDDSVPDAKLYYSSTGRSWSENAYGQESIYEIKNGNGYWVLAGVSKAWYIVGDPSGQPLTAASGPSYCVDYSVEDDVWVVGQYGGIKYCSGIPSGTWTPIDIVADKIVRCVTHGVVNGATVWVAGMDGGYLYTASTPAGPWTARTTGLKTANNDILAASFGNGVFLIGAKYASGNVGGYAISRDGITWFPVIHYTYITCSNYGADRFVLAGESGIALITLRHPNIEIG